MSAMPRVVDIRVSREPHFGQQWPVFFRNTELGELAGTNWLDAHSEFSLT